MRSMPDPRFFEDLGPVTLAELARLSGAELARPDAGDRLVQGVAVLTKAGPDRVTFLSDHRLAGGVGGAGACFVQAKDAGALPQTCVALVTATPQAAYAAAAQRLHRPRPGGSKPIADDAALEDDVAIGPGAVIGPGARIGRGTRIGANAV